MSVRDVAASPGQDGELEVGGQSTGQPDVKPAVTTPRKTRSGKRISPVMVDASATTSLRRGKALLDVVRDPLFRRSKAKDHVLKHTLVLFGKKQFPRTVAEVVDALDSSGLPHFDKIVVDEICMEQFKRAWEVDMETRAVMDVKGERAKALVLNAPLEYFGREEFPRTPDEVVATLKKRNLADVDMIGVDARCLTQFKSAWKRASCLALDTDVGSVYTSESDEEHESEWDSNMDGLVKIGKRILASKEFSTLTNVSVCRLLLLESCISREGQGIMLESYAHMFRVATFILTLMAEQTPQTAYDVTVDDFRLAEKNMVSASALVIQVSESRYADTSGIRHSFVVTGRTHIQSLSSYYKARMALFGGCGHRNFLINSRGEVPNNAAQIILRLARRCLDQVPEEFPKEVSMNKYTGKPGDRVFPEH